MTITQQQIDDLATYLLEASDTITEAEIRALADEAMAAGDHVTVDLCAIALAAHERSDSQGGDLIHPVTGAPTTRSAARYTLADAIRAARAQED